MNFSENTNNLFAALAKFQKECPQIKKDATVKVSSGGQFKYSFDYATYGHILKTVKPILAQNELAVMQSVTSDGVQTIITHSSGQWAKTGYLPIMIDKVQGGQTVNANEQETGSSITYKKRYQLAAVLLQDADDDNDANIADGNEPQITKRSTNQFEPVTKPVDPPKEKKETPKPEPKKEEPKKESKPDPTPQKDDSDSTVEAEINAITDKKELIEWWKKNVKEKGDSFKNEYQKTVFSRLEAL